MATEIDKGIGARLRAARKTAGMSQQALGEKLGVTFQQVQKYENGRNRISGSTLVEITRVLDVDPADLLGTGVKVRYTKVEAIEVMHDSTAIKLLQALSKLKGERRSAACRAMANLVEALA